MPAIKDPEVKYTKLFINNEFVESLTGKTFDTINPATLKKLATVEQAGPLDVDRAIKAAKEAFRFGSPYREMNATQRAALLFKFADLIERDQIYLASLECSNNGKLFKSVLEGDIVTAIAAIRFYAEAGIKVSGLVKSNDDGNFGNLAQIRHEPLGVTGIIIPWSYPIELACNKIAPAIAMGNTIVLKPARQTPLTALYLAALAKEAGFPPGVLNVLPSYGSTTGLKLVTHPYVKLVSFNGSTEAARSIQCEASKHVKRISLELSHKGILIVFPDAYLDEAVIAAHRMCINYQGQSRNGATRTYIHKSIYDEFVEMTTETAKDYLIGDPHNEFLNQGPLIDEEHFKKVEDFIESALKQGAKLETGGKRVCCNLGGFFMTPVVFSNVTDDMDITKEEIIGPVQLLIKFSSTDQVIEQANLSSYGSVAGIFAGRNTARELSLRLDTDRVHANKYLSDGVQIPFSWITQPTIGDELGLEELRQYCKTKGIVIDSVLQF